MSRAGFPPIAELGFGAFFALLFLGGGIFSLRRRVARDAARIVPRSLWRRLPGRIEAWGSIAVGLLLSTVLVARTFQLLSE